MSGPVASLILPKKISSEETDFLWNAIERMADKIKGNDFWVENTSFIGGDYHGEGRPFFTAFGFEYEGEQEAIALELEGKSGIAPVDAIAVGCYSNSDQDHQILAQLCIYFAKELNGVIGFHSDLQKYTSDQSLLNAPGRISTESSGDYFSPDYLVHWLMHPDFRMVK